MDVVLAASQGKVDHDRLVALLSSWEYEPQFVTRSQVDEWQLVDNSIDAIFAAYDSGPISDDEYELITSAAKVHRSAS